MQHRSSVIATVSLILLLLLSVACSGGGSNSNPSTPSITSLSLTTATVGSGDTQLTITGTNFTNSSTVQWANSPIATTFVSSTQLTATIPAADLATAGTFSVTVRNSDTGSTSNAVTFTVSASGPAISALTPSSITAGSAAFTLRVSGSGYTSSSVINWNSTALTTNFLNSSQLAADIPASLIASAGSVNVTVNTPGTGGGTSSPQPFNVNAPLPAITSLNPSNVSAGNPGITLVVIGANFIANSTVRIGTTDKPTTFISPTQLAATIPASDLATAAALSVTVNNPTPGGGTSGPLTLTVSAVSGNRPPVANAGSAQTVAAGSTVHLDGSKSTDADGNTLSYTWSFVSRPAGSVAALSSATAVQPTFVADVAGNYVVQLVVNDGTTNSTASTVTISTTNSAPVANAGIDQTVLFGATVRLDGSASTDVDGQALSYSWTLTSAPAGSSATLANPTTARPTFSIDRPGNYVAQLTVSDGITTSAPATVTISTNNSLPSANAGASQSVAVAAAVHLDGSKSFDVDGDGLAYRWAILSAPAGSNASLSSASDVRPSFVADRAGLYVLQLIVNDGTGDSIPSTMTVSTVNTPPVAFAGLDQAVSTGKAVQLDGTGSSDADGNRLSYRWALVSRPAGSTASVANANSVHASFTPDVAGSYSAQLIVNDGQFDSAPSIVRFSTTNDRPVANAGGQQKVIAGASVQLDGSLATDAEGDALTYKWALLSKPAGSVAFLAAPNAPTASFVADKAGDYVAQLIVSDSTLSSTPSTVVITTGTAAPIANPGNGQTVGTGAPVQLDGSASSDPNGSNLTFAWSLLSAPAGSASVLAGAGTRTPSFTPDVAGDYVVQLVVSNGVLSSSPAAVRVSTVSAAPTADAGSAQQVNVGATVTLDGSASNSPNGGSLTFKWSLLSVPQGSAATLNNAAALSPTFTADKRGTYIAQLIVSDGVYISAPATVEINTNARPPVANAGTDQTVPVGTTVTLDGTGSTSPDGLPLTYFWTFTKLPDGSNPTLTGTSKVTFVPDAVGTYIVQLIVSDGVLTSAPATVTITTTANKTITLTPNPLALDASSAGTMTLTLGQEAPTGGLTVNLTSSDTTIVTVPATVTVAANTTAVSFTVTSLAKAGSPTVTAAATGFTSGTATVNVTARTLTIPALSVGKDLQAATFLTLSVGAPSTNNKLTLTSSDTSKILLSTSATAVGSGTITLQLTSGSSTSPTFYVQSKDSTGSSTLKVTGAGYTDASATVNCVPGGFFAINLDSIDTSPLSADTKFSVAAGALDPTTLNSVTIQQLRAGVGNVSINIDDPNKTIGTITTNPLVFSPGDALKETAFHPLANGSMNLTITPPSGFTAPNNGHIIPVTVAAPAINVGNISVGKDMQVQDGTWLSVGAPAGGVDITITSSDPSKVLLSTTANTQGSGSITMHYAEGFVGSLFFYVQGLANSGSVTLTAKGTQYADSTGTINLAPSGFVITSADINNASVGGSDVSVGIAPAMLDSALNFLSFQQLRAGLTPANVPVSSSNTSVGTITTSPVVFNAGDQAKSTSFHPVGAGTTTLSIATPTGFSTPSGHQSISATVQGAGINSPTNVNTGKDLITSSAFSLATAPGAPVTATVTSSNPSVATVSTSASTAGTSSISFPNTSSQSQTYFVQGIAQGTTTLTIHAPGYTDASVTVTVYASGFIVSKPSLSVSVGSDTSVSISPAVLLPGSLDVYDVQSLRPGVTVQVPIVSSDTTVGTVASPVSVTGGSGTTTFHAVASGTANLTISTPSGYSTPSAFQQVTVTVAGITTTPVVTTGKDLMTSSTFALNTTPPSAVTVTVTSNNPSVATVSTSASTAGTASISFASISTTQANTFFVQGLATGTTTLTIKATGYPDATVTVNVNPSGFVITNSNFSATVNSDTSLTIAPVVLLPGSLAVGGQQQLRPTVSVQVPIASSSTSVGTVTSPVTVTNSSGSTTFHAVAKGSSNISITAPSGYSTPNAQQSITATVQ